MKPTPHPIPLSLVIEDFEAGVILTRASGTKNCVFGVQQDGKTPYLTQRPAVNIVVDASAAISDLRGRACFYWELVGALYFVNAAEVYKDSYAAPVQETGQTVTLTQAAGIATGTAVGHLLVAGDTITVSGANEAEYNVTGPVLTVPTGDTFTYAVDSGAASPATGTITVRRVIPNAVTRCYFYELDTYLVLLDPAAGQGWYITSAASTVLNRITDTDFPADLVRGGVVLDGRLYVMGADGQIFASDAGDPTSWDPLNVIQANYSPDYGVALAEHNKNVVAFGANTIEFFQDVGNPTGSPLQKRQDIFHDIGMASEDSIWTDNNATFFVGVSRTGGLSVYLLAAFELAQISTSEIDSFLTTAYAKEGLHFHASGTVVGGRVFYLLTVYRIDTATGDAMALTTLVYSALGTTVHTWGTWDLLQTGIDQAPLVDWTLTTGSVATRGILINGDLVTFQDDFSPQDLLLAFGPYEAGIYEAGVYVQSGGTGTAIEIEAIYGARDYGTRNRKRHDSICVMGNRTPNSQTMDIYVSDDRNDDWVQVGSIDLSVPGEQINRLGSFYQRNVKMVGSPSERVELTGLESLISGMRS